MNAALIIFTVIIFTISIYSIYYFTVIVPVAKEQNDNGKENLNDNPIFLVRKQFATTLIKSNAKSKRSIMKTSETIRK
jgi:hypothetical protein